MSDTNIEGDSSVSLLEQWVQHDNLSFHQFKTNEAREIQQKLLSWYDQNRRKLPWRGDPPPWEGSTAKSKRQTQKSTKKQRTLNEFFPTSTQGDNDNDDNDVVEAEETQQAFNVTAYGIWVSEIMLQQTRVEAVVPYWVRWMNTFPTVQDLANASEEEVNAQWAGLGFYRRARLLHTAAKEVVRDFNSEIPTTVQGLLKLPGVGRYTASAIASIAYNVTVPVVDGNVCRVLARLKGIANHVKAASFKDKYAWDLVQPLVQDCSRPGDLNQALMELGATYCAPSGTGTDLNDPLREYYYSIRLGKELAQTVALQKKGGLERTLVVKNHGNCPVCATNGVEEALGSMSETLQTEDDPRICGHRALPIPPPKKDKREEVFAVAVLSCQSNVNNINDGKTLWLLSRRPDRGLLANQWEFPAALVWSSATSKKDNGDDKDDCPKPRKRKPPAKTAGNGDLPNVPVRARAIALDKHLEDFDDSDLLIARRQRLKEPIEHVFTHVRHTMWIEHSELDEGSFQSGHETKNSDGRIARWMNQSDLDNVGVTSGVKKVIAAVQTATKEKKKKLKTSS